MNDQATVELFRALIDDNLERITAPKGLGAVLAFTGIVLNNQLKELLVAVEVEGEA